MKKILCLLLLIVMVVPFSSCETKNDKCVYEVVYAGSGYKNQNFFLDIDPLTLESGEACFATFTRYVDGAFDYQTPCMVYVSSNSSGEKTYVFKVIPFDNHKFRYNGDGTWSGVWDG